MLDQFKTNYGNTWSSLSSSDAIKNFITQNDPDMSFPNEDFTGNDFLGGGYLHNMYNIDYDVERNMAEFLQFMNDCLQRKIPVGILDNAYTNGGELQLLRVLNRQRNLMKLTAYAGWNTSANSMGTVLAQLVNRQHQNNIEAAENFLIERYIEDFGYDAVVRGYVTEQVLPQWEMNYFYCAEPRGKAAEAIKAELQKFIEKELTSVADCVTLKEIWLPWSRMFEIGLTAAYQAN